MPADHDHYVQQVNSGHYTTVYFVVASFASIIPLVKTGVWPLRTKKKK